MFAFPKKSRFLLLAFGLLLAFTSCDNEITQDNILPEIETEEEMPDLLVEALPPPPDADGQERRRPCFRFVFPIEIALRNGAIITANDAEELRAAHRRILAANLRANFVYPFDIVLANGEEVTIERFLAIRLLHRACRGRDEVPTPPCFTINYPIEVVSGDSTFTVNSRAELVRSELALRPRGVSFVYPISVTFADDGRVVTVNGARELFRLREACSSRGEDDDRGQSCYAVLYPIDVTIGNRSVTFVSRAAWQLAVRAIRRDVEVAIVYPITLVHRESGEEVPVANREEWEGLREACE